MCPWSVYKDQGEIEISALASNFQISHHSQIVRSDWAEKFKRPTVKFKVTHLIPVKTEFI